MAKLWFAFCIILVGFGFSKRSKGNQKDKAMETMISEFTNKIVKLNISGNIRSTVADVSVVGKNTDFADTTALEVARMEYWAFLESNVVRKPLLCTIFANGAKVGAFVNVINNMLLSNILCDWALVMFDGSHQDEISICNGAFHNDKLKHLLVHCKVAKAGRARAYSRTGSVPKSILYRELLPYLSNYERVFLLDEDIALDSFNSTAFFAIWNCAFQNPPLIVQSPVAQSTQFYKYLTAPEWGKQRHRYIASAVGFVEQQAPAIDALFLKWFVGNVLVHTMPYAQTLGVEWHDKYWCGAAAVYGKHVLGWDNDTVPCALILGAGSLNHLNTHRY